MSWMADLYNTYDNIKNNPNIKDKNKLCPISHVVRKAHIEAVIDINGNFLPNRAKILSDDESPTLIPVTEKSDGRSSGIAPHPLCDTIEYCALDCLNTHNKTAAYMQQLESWTNSNMSHPKPEALLKYLKKGMLLNDLSNELEFPIKIKKEKMLIRWKIETPTDPISETWKDESLIAAWISYDRENCSKNGFCYISNDKCRITTIHPRYLRYPGDKAKLISSNDEKGFTYKGKFEKPDQAAEIGFNMTQKAHNALRWLISRQSYKNEDQVYITFAVSGKNIPDPFKDSWTLLTENDDQQQENIQELLYPQIDHTIDIGESFATSFSKYLAGYKTKINPNEQIVIIGIDSATPGRMGITYYRKLTGSEFLNRVRCWHTQFAWPQYRKYKKETIATISTPTPRNIIEAVYGNILKSNPSLKKNLLKRILPCIVDNRYFPKDILLSAIYKVSNRISYKTKEQWLWKKDLEIVCALIRGFYMRCPKKNERRTYKMGLEKDRFSRDYLYGRLLAIAERIEEVSLSVAGENRMTTAAKLMHRFASRPFSTWRNIELALQPYIQRLQKNRTGFIVNRKKELDDIIASFLPEDFTNDKPLYGEFLLGYHCQREEYKKEKNKKHGEI